MKIETMTIKDIHRAYMERKFTVTEIIKAYLDRIKGFNYPSRTFITLNEEKALEDAKLMDLQVLSSKTFDQLVGIPIAIKDNICTKDLKTTCGSKILKDFIPSYDANLVKKLRKAGGIVLGKTNMKEFGVGDPGENTLDGVKDMGCILDGGVASVAAGLAPLAIATDTRGETRHTAFSYGLVGMKASPGLISRSGVISLSSSLDHIGLISRTVEDCALSLGKIQAGTSKDYIEKLRENIRGIRIAVPKELFSQDWGPDIDRHISNSITILEQLGAHIKEVVIRPMADEARLVYDIISSVEASYNLARYDGIRYGHRTEDYEDIDELVINSRSEGFGKEIRKKIILGTYILSSNNCDGYYNKALLMKERIEHEFQKIFETYDVLLNFCLPADPLYNHGIAKDLLPYAGGFNIIGTPAISIPCGFNANGHPIGLDLMGNYLSEEGLLNIAYHLEQAFQVDKSIVILEEKNNGF